MKTKFCCRCENEVKDGGFKVNLVNYIICLSCWQDDDEENVESTLKTHDVSELHRKTLSDFFESLR